MNFENIIRQEAAAMGLTYKYGPLPYLNQVLDALLHGNDAPACLNIQPVDGTYSFDETPLYRRGRETQRTKVAMSRKIALDYDPQKVAELTDELKGLGVSLLTRLQDTGLFEDITDMVWSVLYDAFDVNLVAVVFEFSLTEKDGTCLE